MSGAAPEAPTGFSAERPARLAVLISGRGSNMLSLADAAARPEFPATLSLVVSNEQEAPGLAAAAARGVATEIVDHRAFAQNRRGFEELLDNTLMDHAIDTVCLAGFMRVLSPYLVDRWRDRILNIHPSLLPAFRGLNTHARAIAARVKLHGATVHLVRAALDDGPILAQAALPVHKDDTPETLAARLLPIEHQLYPEALKRYLHATANGASREEPLFAY